MLITHDLEARFRLSGIFRVVSPILPTEHYLDHLIVSRGATQQYPYVLHYIVLCIADTFHEIGYTLLTPSATPTPCRRTFPFSLAL